jgi:trimethylamine--corrinoid protein Co-methyltransferase
MLDFESCQSLEKLVVDDEIAGSVLRMTRGIEPKEDFPALPRFQELLHEGHLLVSRHTRCLLAEEHRLPGAVVDRENRARWHAEGSKTLGERARAEVRRHLAEYRPSRLDEGSKRELVRIMEAEANRLGMQELPDR